MEILILIFVFSTVCFLRMTTTFTAGMTVARSKSIQAPVTNMVSYQDRLYVGGANNIYVLDKDLNILQKTSTCKEPATVCKINKNINKILLIDKKREWLVACGTGDNGICELRNLSIIDEVISKSSALRSFEKSYLTVSSDIHRPAVATITQRGELVIAVTFGNGIREEKERRYYRHVSYFNAISTRHFRDFATDSHMQLRLIINQPSLEDYLIYYKASFQSNWMTYFVTNQKRYVGAINFVSKLVRICQNDTDYRSYTDVVIQCTYDGEDYNLIQDAILLNALNSSVYNTSSMIFVGAFSRGNNPEDPSGGTAICVTKLSSLDDAIMTAKKEYALSCNFESFAERYLRSYKGYGRLCLDETEYQAEDFFCFNFPDAFSRVIGKNIFKMKSTFKISNEDGIVTTLHGTTYLKNQFVLLLGTSTGKLLQTNLLGDFSIEEYGSETIDGSYPVKRMYAKDDDTLYVVTSHNVIKYHNTNCSEYSTCNEMAGKNPLCGWCIYKERVTRSRDCPHGTDYWLSSFGKCVSLSAEPRGISLKYLNTNVTLKVGGSPVKEDSDYYSCKFVRGSQVLSTTTAVPITTTTFNCELPQLSAHTEAVIELHVKTKTGVTAVLSSTSFLFYDCGFYRSCIECVNTMGTKCDWCSATATCQETKTCEMQSIPLPTECPRLIDSRGKHFIPDRIRTLVVFPAQNLILHKTFIYKCILIGSNVEVVADTNATSISCLLNIIKTSGIRKEDYKISVAYGPEYGKLAEVNDDFQNIVTVYDCTELASDCSHCESLNKTRYQCDWCQNGQCLHRSTKCDKTKCPSPTVTKVIPRDGPVQGGTRLTVLGTNLGKDISKIENISVAGIPCSLNDNRTDYNATESQDFEAHPPSRLVCTTNAATGEITGITIVTVDDQSSQDSVQFAYKMPTITEISPNFGPVSGGTRVTISGDNLGIGNRQVDIVLGNKKCLQTEVYPDLPLDTEDEISNFTIRCTTANSTVVENVTSVYLKMNNEFVGSHAVLYSYVADPVITSVSTKKGFVSGGTKINFEGKGFHNAHMAFLKIQELKDSMVEDCEIMSTKQTLCKVPRASPELAEDILRLSQLTMQESTTCDGCLNIPAVLSLDGVMYNFTMSYFRDPIIHSFSTDDNIVTLDPNYPRLNIHGEYLTLVATSDDVRIKVGSGPCAIVNLTFSTIECYAPITKPLSGMPGAKNPEVNVTIGNIHKTVGFVRYTEDDKSGNIVLTVVSVAVSVGFLILVVTGIIVLYRKYRKMKEKVRLFERAKDESEMKEIVRETRPTIVHATGTDEGAGLYAEISEEEMIQANERPEAERNYEKIDDYLEARPYLPCNETDLGDCTGAVKIVRQLTQSPSVDYITKRSIDLDYLHPISGDEN